MSKQSWADYLKTGLSRTIPTDKVETKKGVSDTRSNLGSLKPYLMRYWRKAVLGSILILIVSLLTLPQPIINRFLVDNVILAKRLDLLPIAIIMIGGIKLFSMGAGLMQQYYFTHFQQLVMRDIDGDLLDHTLSLPKSFFDDKEVGYLISRLSTDVQGLSWFFSSTVVSILGSIFRFIGGVIFLFYLNWRLGIVTLIVLPLLIWGTRYFSQRLRALSHHNMERYAAVTQRFQETLATIPLIKAFASEKKESDRVIKAVTASQQIEMEQVTVSSVANVVLGIVPNLAGGVVLIAGVYWVIRGQWTLGSLLAFQSYLGYVYGPAMSLSNANLQLQNSLTALERVSAIFRVTPEVKQGTGIIIDHLKGNMAFENVSFSYNGEELVLKDITFKIQRGEHVVIAGPSGVGKTTLLSLLLQFYRPTKGRILFDDHDATQYELKSLRERIGFVSQSTLLLAGTIRDNLCYGNADATQEQVEKATMVAGIKDYILSLSDGYDTVIEERGVNLSDGQKQRLSIARALIKDPDILILDEPTSALDTIIEQSIFDALPKVVKEKTLIIVTHRLSTIQRAHRIFVLKDGYLIASGNHSELLMSNSYYQSLFTA